MIKYFVKIKQQSINKPLFKCITDLIGPSQTCIASTSLMASQQIFKDIGNDIFCNAVGIASGTSTYRFRALLGVTPLACAEVWRILCDLNPLRSAAKPQHLLGSLLFLKCYATETVNHIISGVDEKTFQK